MATAAALAAAGVARAAGSQPSQREQLPGDVQPDHYQLSLTPDAAQLRFSAQLRIDVRVLRPTRVITLNALGLVIDSVALDGSARAPRLHADERRQTLSLEFASPLPAGRHQLAFDYHGAIGTQANGLFALDYDTPSGTQRALFTQFEPTDARRLLPCWDEPARKATFTLIATVPDAQMAVSNMPVAEAVPAGAGLQRVRFQDTPKMSPYLLFFGSGDFERSHRLVDGVDVGVVVKRGDTARAAYALDAAAQILPFYNEYFGTPFPLPKLDLVAGPGSSAFFSAMENWGAIFSFERVLLLDPAISTEHDRREVFGVTAHEMAHQWFGDLVTMQWWEDLWLNEGFATWMASKATGRFHPDWQAHADAMANTQVALRIDSAVGTHPIVTPIRDALQSAQAFDEITYEKGAAVIGMLEAHTGETQFRNGVRRYMRAHAYGNSVSDDLWHAIDAPGNARPVTRIAHDFTLHAGVPLVNARSLGCTGGRQLLAVSQGRFAIDESGRHGTRTWQVPVMIRSVDAAAGRALVVSGAAPHSLVIDGCAPVLVNAGQDGYFVSRYLGEALPALAARYGELALVDQLGLLGDTAALAFAGAIPLSDYLDLDARVPAGADPLVWQARINTLVRLDALEHGQPGQEAFRVHARGALAPLLAQLGWDARDGENGNTALARRALLTALARFGDGSVLAEARRRFARFLQERSSLDAAVRATVLEIVASQADAGEWQQLHDLARASGTGLEKLEYYGLLASAQDAALSQRALDLALGEEAPATLRTGMYGAAARVHPEATLAFVLAHYARIEPVIDASSRASFVPYLGFDSAELATNVVLEGYAARNIPDSGRSTLVKVEARVRDNNRIRARLGEVDRWVAARALQRNGSGT